MEKTKSRKSNKFVQFFKDYFADFGFRQISTIVMLVASIVVIVGVSIPNEVTTLVGMYLFAAMSLWGVIHSVRGMVKAHYRKSPAFKRAMITLIIMAVILAIAILGIVFTHINGIYRA